MPILRQLSPWLSNMRSNWWVPTQVVTLFFALGAPVDARLMYGMLDSDGKIILPFQYASITHAENGYLLVTPLSSDQKSFLEPFYVSEDGKWIGGSSEETNMQVGSRSSGRRIPFVGAENPAKVKGVFRKRFPRSVNYIFGEGDNGWFPAVFGGEQDKTEQGYRPGNGSKMGFVDRSGKVQIAPAFESASKFRRGRAIVSIRSNDNNDAAGKNVRWGLVDESGKLVFSGYSGLYGYGNSFVAATQTDESFDAAMWRNPEIKNIAGYNRIDEWHQFLDSYDLIGMPRSRVYELLGDPDEIPRHGRSRSTLPEAAPVVAIESLGRLAQLNYRLWNCSCGTIGSSGVQIEFDVDDAVSGWRFTRTVDEEKKYGRWVRENVRFDAVGFEKTKELGALAPALYVRK